MARASYGNAPGGLQGLGIALAVPGLLAGGLILGYFAGRWVDERWGTAPWLSLAGVLLGAAGACVHIYRMLQWISQSESQRNGKPSSRGPDGS